MRFRLYRTLFILFLVCEILLTTSQRLRYFGFRENAIVLVLLAALMGLFAILASFEKAQMRVNLPEHPWEKWLRMVVVGVGVVLCVYHFQREISVIPIDIRLSDILPTVQVMNQRLLQGQYPYDLIQDFGYDLNPTYLPMMWMPFLPAALLDFDERWMAFLIWAIATVLLIRQAYVERLGTEAKWLITLLPFFHFVIIEEGTDATFGNTFEIMIAGFYMLFALQLTKIRAFLAGSPIKSGAVIAVFISLCLLSRYSFLLWLPLCFVVVWTENRKLALSTAAWVLGFVLVIFVIPFLSQDPMIYFNGLKHYSKAALGEWNNSRNSGAMYDGLGVAGLFHHDLEGEMSERLAALQRTQFVVSMAAVVLCGLIWWKKRAKMQHLPLFLLGSLKFYFAFFYGFIQMPYTYLMLTPCFLSVAMLVAWYRQEETSVHS
jgi:hypothetical protein